MLEREAHNQLSEAHMNPLQYTQTQTPRLMEKMRYTQPQGSAVTPTFGEVGGYQNHFFFLCLTGKFSGSGQLSQILV